MVGAGAHVQAVNVVNALGDFPDDIVTAHPYSAHFVKVIRLKMVKYVLTGATGKLGSQVFTHLIRLVSGEWSSARPASRPLRL